MTMDGTTSAFFYGTLMAPAVLNRVTTSPRDPPRKTPLGPARPAILYNHRRHRVRGADYPAIVPIPASTSSTTSAASDRNNDNGTSNGNDSIASVRGVYVDGLTASDMFRLDLFEGSQYTRRKVTVKLLPLFDANGSTNGAGDAKKEEGEEEWVIVQTYIWTDDLDELEDQEWDFDEFVKEKMWRWAPAEFRDLDRAVEASAGGGVREKNGTCEGDPTGGRHVNGKFEEALREIDQRME